MRKNGSRLISFARYRATDLLIFAAILVAFGLISFFAFTRWFTSDISTFFFSVGIPVSLLVMVRWGWYGMFYAVADGLLYCTLSVLTSGGEYYSMAFQYYLTYAVGGAFVGLAYLMVRFMGYRRITSAWYFTLLYMLCGWVAVLVGRVLVSLCFGENFLAALLGFMGPSELLSLAMGIVILLIMRRLDGMMENQRDYLIRLDKERREKLMADNFGEQPVEIDEETLRSLNKKGGDMFG